MMCKIDPKSLSCSTTYYINQCAVIIIWIVGVMPTHLKKGKDPILTYKSFSTGQPPPPNPPIPNNQNQWYFEGLTGDK